LRLGPSQAERGHRLGGPCPVDLLVSGHGLEAARRPGHSPSRPGALDASWGDRSSPRVGREVRRAGRSAEARRQGRRRASARADSDTANSISITTPDITAFELDNTLTFAHEIAHALRVASPKEYRGRSECSSQERPFCRSLAFAFRSAAFVVAVAGQWTPLSVRAATHSPVALSGPLLALPLPKVRVNQVRPGLLPLGRDG
jgi:hypothetical protein